MTIEIAFGAVALDAAGSSGDTGMFVSAESFLDREGHEIVVIRRQVGGEVLGRLPDLQEAHHGQRGGERGDDVGQLDRDVVRADELGERERAATDQCHRPRLPDAAPAVHDGDQRERHEDGEDRRLPTDHRPESVHG